MKQVDAKREILREWRALPKEERQTEADATRFAFTVVNKYNFGGDTADRYQTIWAWLLRDMSLIRPHRFGIGGRLSGLNGAIGASRQP